MTELSRLVPLDRIGPAGLQEDVEARPQELEALARRMRIPAVRRLRCEFRLRRVGGGLIEADGRLEAEVVQVCVASLDEFAQAVQEEFRLEFVPSGSETENDDPDSPDQIPYEGAAIDLGEAAAEQLALALDPYPRKPGAVAPGADEPAATGPFAGLAALRGKH